MRGPKAGVQGQSSLQALCLALRFARQQLHEFVDKGGRVFVNSQGVDEVPLDAIFGDMIDGRG